MKIEKTQPQKKRVSIKRIIIALAIIAAILAPITTTLFVSPQFNTTVVVFKFAPDENTGGIAYLKTNPIDSAAAMCRRDMNRNDTWCQIGATANIARFPRIMQLPYSKTLHSLSYIMP